MSPAEDPELQRLSKAVFGQTHRLAVMLAIARGEGIFSPGDLSRELGYPSQSIIQNPLRDLETAGLILRSPHVEGMRKVYYERIPSSAWQWVEELAHRAEAKAASTDR